MPVSVLMVHSARDSASEYKVHRLLAKSANPENVRVHLLCQDSPLARKENAELSAEDVTYLDFGRDMHTEPKPSRNQRAWLMARRALPALTKSLALGSRLRPDVIYASQQKYDVFLGRWLSLRTGAPLWIHVHYNVGPWLGGSTLSTIKKADHVIGVSQFIVEGAKNSGLPEERLTALLNASDLKRFEGPREPSYVRTTFGLDEQSQIIVAAGRIDPSKGHLDLLEAFATIHAQYPEARVLVCGESTLRDGFEERVKQRAVDLGIHARVIFAGARRDLPQIFAGADIFCLPTVNDPCPLVFLEAMAQGLPAVAYHSGGVPEMVADGETGLLCATGQQHELAGCLSRLLGDKALAEQLGAAGQRRAVQQFHPSRAAEKWTSLLTARLRPKDGLSPSVLSS